MLLTAMLVATSFLAGFLPAQERRMATEIERPRRLPPVDGPARAFNREVLPIQFIELIPKPPPEPPFEKASSLSLSELESMALTGNPSIGRAAALVTAARGNHIQVGLRPNPAVGYQGQQIGSGGLAEQHGVYFNQDFIRGGKLKLNREVAAQEWARAEQELAAQQQRVLTDVRINYYQVMVAQEQERLTTELLGISKQALQSAEGLLKGKEVGRIDVVQAQVEAENADMLVQNAQNRRAAAWQSLAVIIGNPGLPLQLLDGDLRAARGEFKWQESLDRVLTNSPEIAVAVTNIERARWAVQRALVEKTPDLSFQGLVNWQDNGIGGRSDGGVSLGVPLPLWNKNQGGILRAQGEVAAAERALDQLELALQNRLAPVYERYANALGQVTKYRDRILPAAQESLDLTRQLHKGGETSVINLLIVQRTYSQTNLNYLESLRQLRTSEAEIEGLLLSGSLESR